MRNLLKKEKGFTLIEIVLVLAIAGLLLVIVFLAVQGAQRSRRDTQRKEDAARVLAAMEQCASNNSGQYAAACTTGLITGGYFTGKDPDGTTYSIGAPATTPGKIDAATGPGCTDNAGTAHVTIRQEAGSTYCVHN